MNSKIFVFAAVIGLGAVIGGILISGSTLENLASPKLKKKLQKFNL